VTVAVFIAVLLGAGAIGVDVARLAFTATELQSVADASAVAGANTLLGNVQAQDARDPIDDAIAIAARNHVDGEPATLARSDVILGRWDTASSEFLAGGVPNNAVQAVATATVANIIAGVLGAPTSTVTRQAMAAMGGVGSAAPTLPIVVGECKFRAYQNSSSGSCSALPTLSLVPDPTDNSGWTSLSEQASSASESQRFLPQVCGGGGLPAPGVRVGQSVNVMNGDATSVLHTLEECFRRGIREFTIPIVTCGNRQHYNQAMEVTGFATIRISQVNDSGKKKGVDLEAICETQGGGGIGPNDFGTQTVALVR
jgi:hypothetical protein